MLNKIIPRTDANVIGAYSELAIRTPSGLGVRTVIRNMSKPLNRSIKSAALYDFKNLPPFNILTVLPTIPAIIVATQHATAVGPPRVNLQRPDISATGIPTYGPPSNPDIITTNPRELAGTPLTSIVKYDARIPSTAHMTICHNRVLGEVSPLTTALKLLDFVAI